MSDKIADQISLFRAQITNRKFDDETLRILDSVLVAKDVRSLLQVRSQLKEFLRCESLRIIREIVEKAVDHKLLIIDFLVRAFALSGDVESCLALRYEALVMREMKSSSNPWLHVSYGEWFTFAEHCLDNRFYSIAIKASEKALTCIQMKTEIQPPTNDHIEKEQVIEKIKRLNSVAVISDASQSVQAQAAAYLKKKILGHKRKISPICKEKTLSASSLFRSGIRKRNRRKLQEHCSLLKSPATQC
ncbi:protein DOUBLE-STRAND BREAK FORMATION [Heracleum sosnowskyi]|uniref:Protein DOUBLE-STRAND BREAK FORMATION n=1 Tax=Heracleum sosnowskyi TaxID=360622 RepID=A0AAD8GUP9_9APIA|nr:protein DOUBLE-STRAND BREAK FORMATION [Heracleum sosnowskyi]